MKPSDTVDVDTRPQPTADAIAIRAFQIFCDRHGTPGDGGQEDDWHRAEAELRSPREDP